MVQSASAQGAVTALAYSPDGKRLAVGAYKQVVVFDTEKWVIAARFSKIEDSVRSLAYHPSGGFLAIGSGLPGRTGTLTFWDGTSATPMKTIGGQADSVESVAFRQDGNALIYGCADKKGRYFPNYQEPKSTVLDEHNDRINAVAISPRNDTIYVTGAMDKLVKVWNARTGETVVNLDQSAAGISGLVFLSNGNQFVGSSLDGRLHWWQVNFDAGRNTFSGNRFRQVDAHPGQPCYALAISRDGQRLATGGQDNVVNIWNANNGGKIKELKDSPAPIYAVALNQDGKQAAAAGRDGQVRIWDVDGAKLLQTLSITK
jgi:WD40 repeat protein